MPELFWLEWVVTALIVWLPFDSYIFFQMGYLAGQVKEAGRWKYAASKGIFHIDGGYCYTVYEHFKPKNSLPEPGSST